MKKGSREKERKNLLKPNSLEEDDMMMQIQPKVKIWLIIDNEPVIGEGRALLLHLIKEKGSISRAAQEMNMSYRAAWGKIKVMEKRLGYSVVKSKAGGGRGGFTFLTEEGEVFLKKYKELIATVEKSVDSTFSRLFLHPP